MFLTQEDDSNHEQIRNKNALVIPHSGFFNPASGGTAKFSQISPDSAQQITPN